MAAAGGVSRGGSLWTQRGSRGPGEVPEGARGRSPRSGGGGSSGGGGGEGKGFLSGRGGAGEKRKKGGFLFWFLGV